MRLVILAAALALIAMPAVASDQPDASGCYTSSWFGIEGRNCTHPALGDPAERNLPASSKAPAREIQPPG